MTGPPDSESLSLTAVGDVRIAGPPSEGKRCVVYRGEWRGKRVALKVYKPAVVEHHARFHPRQELAELEYRRNRAFYEVPDLGRYVAEPLAYLFSGGVSAIVQEWLHGESFLLWARERERGEVSALLSHVRRLVDLAHDAGLHDIGLAPASVMVVTTGVPEPAPKLFDFAVRKPNRLLGSLVRLGLLDPRKRDLSHLRRF